MKDLERRYRKLLLAYPARYRADRGEEIVDTYLETAGPDRRWPALADIRDALGGGLRQHLRAAGSTEIASAVPVAAMLAMSGAVTLAVAWLLLVEIRATPADFMVVRFGPFQSMGAVVWMGWLLAGVAALTLPGRVARGFALTALAGTIAVVPAAALTPYDRPPLLVLVPQAALGVATLRLPDRSHRAARLGMALAVVVAATLAAVSGPVSTYGYRVFDSRVLAAGAAALLATGLTVAAVRGSLRQVWAVALLLPATALLLIEPLAQAATVAAGVPRSDPADWSVLAVVAAGTAVLACAALVLTAAFHARRVHSGQTRSGGGRAGPSGPGLSVGK
ncbi:MAG TPA: hypothetical protein VGJ07_21995 [Rugosimonospora sp.]